MVVDDFTIHEYEPSLQKRVVERFYQEIYTKHKTRRLLKMILVQGKRSWSIGMVAILTATLLIKRTSIGKLLILWNVIWVILWYRRLVPLYNSWIQYQTQRCMDQLTGKVWFITHNNNNNNNKARHILGVAIFDQYEQEGQIQVTAQGSRIELALVQTAIQFARQQHVKVITQALPEKHLGQFLLK